jgi:hypothetical protein
MLFGMFGSMLWWPILATIITLLTIAFNSEIDSELGYDLLGIYGGAIWQEIFAGASVWVFSIFLFWLSGVSFANGWDAVSDFAKWTRRMKTNPSVSADIAKLRDLLN